MQLMGVSIYGFYGHLMTSHNIEIVLSNPIASQLRYLGYGATPSGLKAAGNDRDNRLQCFLLIILIVRSRWYTPMKGQNCLQGEKLKCPHKEKLKFLGSKHLLI